MSIRTHLPASVFTLLLLAEITTCALLSTGTTSIISTTTIAFQDNWNITADGLQSVNYTRSQVTVTLSNFSHQNGSSENSTDQPTSTRRPSDAQPQPSTDHSTSSGSPTTKGLSVLFRMTSTWLDVIQPPGKNLYDELKMESAINATPSQPLQAVSRSLSSKAKDDPKYFVRYWVGFAVCVAFGVLFIVLMPIVLLIVCVCRCCCHKCGHEKTGTLEKSRDKAKRTCLGILLFFFTIVILAGTVCAFMSNELVRQQTTSEKNGEGGGLVSTLVRNLEAVDAFKSSTVKEVGDLLVQMNSTFYAEINKLKGLPELVDKRLRDVIGTELTGNISTLNTTLFKLAEALRMVDSDSEQLRNLYSVLNDSLTVIENNLTTLCSYENFTICHSLDLTRGLSDPNQMPNISAKLTSVDSTLSQGINVSVFEDVSRRIQQELQSVLNDISNVDISEALSTAKLNVHSAADKLDLKPMMEAVNDTREDIDKYGRYRFNVSVAICSLLLLIILLILIGLCIGVCSNPPYDIDETSGVTRWTAAQFLMASVVIMFLFCSVLMAIVTVLFVSGGVIYTDGCRGFDQQQDNALVKIADSVLKSQLGNVSLYGALRDCRENVGIVKALNLDKKFRISDSFEFSALDDLESKINTSSIDLSQLKFDGPMRMLEKLQNSSLTNINFTGFDDMLNDTRLRSSLAESTNNLNATAQNISDTRTKRGLEENIQRLNNLSETIVIEITNKTEHLRVALKELNDSLYVENSTKTLTDFLTDIERLLDVTGNRTKNDATRIIQQLIYNVSNNTISNVKREIENIQTKVLTTVGGCSPVSNAVDSSVAAVCHSTLDPYNAFWFSYGWCVFFFIPTIAIAVVLAQLYWRLDLPPQSYHEMSGYDAYKSYPDEYLRLHNINASQQDPRRQPEDVNGANRDPAHPAQPLRGPDYAQGPITNPGYIDYGDNDQGNAVATSNPSINGIDFYRGVGHHGNGSYDNPTYSDNDSNGYRIPRPSAAHAHRTADDDEDNRGRF